MPRQNRPAKVLKTYRVPADLYEKAMEKGQREGVNITDVLLAALEAFVAEDDQKSDGSP